MIDFTTLQGLTIPEGVVTQITDESGRVIWAVMTDKPIVLKVEKITSNTYAGETSYTSEQFILLDIYPKTNGTVKVTYDGLTKTITDTSGAEEPNAQQVFFGTFNGVSDSVATAASGTLTIEGDCVGFGISSFTKTAKSIGENYCNCVTAIIDFGNIKEIENKAFLDCDKITSVVIPEGVVTLANGSFALCDNLESVKIPSSVKNIFNTIAVVMSEGYGAFYGCNKLTNIIIDSKNPYYSSDGGAIFNADKTAFIDYPAVSGDYIIPQSVTAIKSGAFYGNTNLTGITIPAGVIEISFSAFYSCTALTNIIVLAETPPALITTTGLGYLAFNGTTCPITVPIGCGETYKAAEGWSDYADRIVEAE